MTAGTLDVLTPDTVAQLLILAYAPGVHGVAVVGSAARGDTTAWSDIDVHAYVVLPTQKQDARAGFMARTALMGERLVMVATDTVEDSRAELRSPERAIWAVPAFRDMRILLDNERKLLALKQEAEAFDWSTMRAAAEASERRRLVASAEYVHKIRAAMERRDELAALHAAGALIGRCTRAIVTARGVLIRTENAYYARAQEAGGAEWAKRHRHCFGLASDGPVALDAFAQALAAARLYAETVHVLDDILDAEAREITTRAIALLT